MPLKTITALGRIKQAALDRLVARFEREFEQAELPPELQMGLNPPRGTALDGIIWYDGTAGVDNRPDFVRADDERIDNGA